LGYRIEFDSTHRIVHLVYDDGVTETSFLAGLKSVEYFAKLHSISGIITDFSAIGSGDFRLSNPFLRAFAQSHSSIASGKPRIIVAPQPAIFGLARMYRTLRESVRDSTVPGVARTFEDALKLLGVESPEFKPVDPENFRDSGDRNDSTP